MNVTNVVIITVNPPGLGARAAYTEAQITLRNVSPTEAANLLKLWFDNRLVAVVSEVDQ